MYRVSEYCPSCAHRRDEIVAQLVEHGESEPGSQAGVRQVHTGARSAAILELRKLKAKVDNHRELRDEVCSPTHFWNYAIFCRVEFKNTSCRDGVLRAPCLWEGKFRTTCKLLLLAEGYMRTQFNKSNSQVEVKLRVLTKRGKARRDRVEILTAEKKDCETQQTSTKV